MSQDVIAILDDLAKRFGIAVDWTAENVMPQIYALGEKIVAYELWTSVVWLVLSVIVIALAILAIKKWGIEDMDILAMFPIGSIAGFVVCAVVQIFDIVACSVFPEKIIFEFIQTLLK